MRHDSKKTIQTVTRVICASLVMFAYLVFAELICVSVF